MFPTVDAKVPDARGVVTTWLVAEGEHVRAGQLLADVRVGEATGQIAAPAEGTLRRVVREGESLRQGEVVAVLE